MHQDGDRDGDREVKRGFVLLGLILFASLLSACGPPPDNLDDGLGRVLGEVRKPAGDRNRLVVAPDPNPVRVQAPVAGAPLTASADRPSARRLPRTPR